MGKKWSMGCLFFLLGTVFLWGDNPYIHKEITVLQLWKLYRFAHHQKNFVAHYHRYYKNRLFYGVGWVRQVRKTTAEGGVVSVHLAEKKTGYSMILWVDSRLSPEIYELIEKVRVGESLQFYGNFIESVSNEHLRLIFIPQWLDLFTPQEPIRFKPSFGEE